MFPLRPRGGLSQTLLLIAVLVFTLWSLGCGDSNSTSTNPGGTVPPPTTNPPPPPPPPPPPSGPSLGVGTAPAQASFLYGTFGEVVSGGRVTSNGQVIDVPMPTDPNSGDTGFETGTGGLVDSIAPDPKGRFLYTLDVQTSSFGIPIGENGIGAFTENHSTGELTRIPGSPYKVSFRGGTAVEDGNGLFLFIAGTNTNTIDTYSIDQGTGALTKTVSLPSSAGDQLTASWDGHFLFNGGNGNVVSYSIGSNGALTQVSKVAVQNVGPMFLSYSGKFLYSVSNNGITAMSVTNTGQLTVTQVNFPAVQVAGGLPRRMIATSRDDQFAFIATSSGDNIGALQGFKVDPTTGAIGSAIGMPVTFMVGESPLQVTLDFNGKFLYSTFTGISLQTSPVNADGTLGKAAINPGVAGNIDFFELSP